MPGSSGWSRRRRNPRRQWRGWPTALSAVPRRDRRAGNRRLVVHGRSDPGSGGVGGGDAVPADPRRSGGIGGRAFARAHFGVLFKGAKALEALARITTLILDKTGTLTDGRPQIVSIDRHGDLSEDDILYFVAALDQASKHPIAQAIVGVAQARGIALPIPASVVETPGEGVAGTIDGRRVVVGGAAFVAAQVGVADPESTVVEAGSVVVSLGVDGKLAGHIVMADALRAGTAELLSGLRHLGVGRILLATGDRRAVAEAVTEGLGLDALRADLPPTRRSCWS